MHLLFDIFQGIGMAAAVGIRPFLPALAVGALAAGDVEIHFKATDYSFLQAPVFLLALAVAAIALALVERRRERALEGRGPVAIGLSILAVGLGGLLFAASLCRGHYAQWPGYLGGFACAVVAILATRPLFARVRARLGGGEGAVLPAFLEGLGVLVAVLSVLAPPIGPVALAALLWLLVAARRRGEQKFAGLRILR